jgi:hypothetical protein
MGRIQEDLHLKMLDLWLTHHGAVSVICEMIPSHAVVALCVVEPVL